MSMHDVSGEHAPIFSVIVPSYKRPQALAACLEALARLEGPSFEVIVVDDGSPEPAAKAAAGLEAVLRLTVIRQENKGPAAARNKGAGAARGRFLAFTDDDCRPAPGWLAGFLPVLQRTPNGLAGGHTVNAEADNLFSQASQDLVGFLCGEGDGPLSFHTSNNIACEKEAFLSIGGFDEAFPLAAGEDRDLCMRWRSAGCPLLQAPDACVDHHHTLDVARFFRQHAAYGRGARTLAQRLAARGEPAKPGLRAPFFYAGLLAYPFRAGGGRAAERASLLFLSQIATAWGFFSGARR